MTGDINTKQSFGTVRVDHFSPARKEEWPKAINVVLSFEEALKRHLGLGQALAKLNTYDRSTKRGRDSAVNLCVFTDVGSVTINEGQVRRGRFNRAGATASRYPDGGED